MIFWKILAVQPGCVARNVNSGDQTTTMFQLLNIFNAPCFKASFMKRACFWRFLLNNCVQIKDEKQKACFHWIDKF